MKTLRKGLCSFAILCLFIISAVFFNSCFTQATNAADLDFNLQVSPAQVDLGTLEPGTTYEGTFEVQNPGSYTYGYTTSIAPYNVTNAQYDAQTSERTSYNEIVDWITIENGANAVAPKSAQKVKYIINVPTDAPAGAQQAAILVTMQDDNTGGQNGVQTIRQVGMLLYSNITGETRTTGEIIKNNIPTFVFNPPLVTTSIVRNDGNIYTRAEYRLEITNFFSGDIAYSNTHYEKGEEYGETLVIMPESERYNEVAWEKAPAVGIFKVKQTIRIFDEESVAEKIVILCPLWLLFIILVFIAIAVYWIVSRIIGRKSR